jgi:hypothetical protein
VTANFKAAASVPNSVRTVAEVAEAIAVGVSPIGGGLRADQMTVSQLLAALDNIAYSDTLLKSDKGNLSFRTNLILLGETIFNEPEKTYAEDFPFDYATEPQSFDTTHLSQTVQVGPFPVTFEVWGEVQYGATLNGEIKANTQTKSCDASKAAFTAALNLEPFVRTNAAASVAIGVPGFEAGIRGRVEMLTIKIPIHSTAKVAVNQPKDQTNTLGMSLEFKTDGTVELSELGGSLSAFVELLFYDAEKEIFSWDSLHQTIPLWTVNKTIPLEAFNCQGDCTVEATP